MSSNVASSVDRFGINPYCCDDNNVLALKYSSNYECITFSTNIGTTFAILMVGNSLLLGHGPFGLEITLIFKGTEPSWEGTKASLKIEITQPI